MGAPVQEERYHEALHFTFSCGGFEVAQTGWVSGFVTTFEPVQIFVCA